ncbi:223_t:CDS:2 [Diversispora eburnea]|uniref:223_t:CDS:1 n=1 Tax=Diversispora eburnea TaxID=1213867 RepID=A0A9N9G2A3_9GLOM|nr:223_t:CDS:2 [Diversispora eburnea]
MTNRSLYRSIGGDDQHYSRFFRLFNKLNKLRFILVAILFFIFIILLGNLIFRENFTEKFNKENGSSGLIIAKNGAVASEVANCSQFGVDVLKEGGNAVDAAITSMICVGTVNSFSAGIGGGGFMLIRLPNGSAEVIDFREVAPIKSNKYMLNSDNKPGLTIGVP